MKRQQIALASIRRDGTYLLRALMFLGGLAALVLALAGAPHMVMAQNGHQAVAQNGANSAARMKAPIGHRQPRPQDLPPGVNRSEGAAAATPEQQALDRKLEICRNC